MTLLDTQREASAFALPLQGVVQLETITFLTATALQHCKLLLADLSPPYRFNCLWACSFHCQFHDSRFVLERGDFCGGETGRRRDLLVGKIHGL